VGQPDLAVELAEPIMVTGGSGFIGSQLVRRLRGAGREVLSPRSAELDLRQWSQTEAYFETNRPRTVFHLASTARGRRDCSEILEVFTINTVATVHLLEACRRLQVQRVIVTGTGDESGSAAATEGLRSTAERDAPRSVYAASKAAGTLFCEAFGRFSELRPTVLRLFAVYGPEQSLDFLLPQLLEALRSGRPLAMTGGQQRRDFLWLEDVLEVLIAVAAHPEGSGRTLDVCTGSTTSLRELVELLAELSGRPVPAHFGAQPYRPGEPFVVAGHPEPLERLIGRRLTTPLRDGLSRLLAVYGMLAGGP
jgi:nucleoside-diphosphate-sugar epimerase